MHDETYRMLGREHEADLERDARKWKLAAEARGSRHEPAGARYTNYWRKSSRFARTRIVARVMRMARAEG